MLCSAQLLQVGLGSFAPDRLCSPSAERCWPGAGGSGSLRCCWPGTSGSGPAGARCPAQHRVPGALRAAGAPGRAPLRPGLRERGGSARLCGRALSTPAPEARLGSAPSPPSFRPPRQLLLSPGSSSSPGCPGSSSPPRIRPSIYVPKASRRVSWPRYPRVVLPLDLRAPKLLSPTPGSCTKPGGDGSPAWGRWVPCPGERDALSGGDGALSGDKWEPCPGEGSSWSLQGRTTIQGPVGLLRGPAPADLWGLGTDSEIG